MAESFVHEIPEVAVWNTGDDAIRMASYLIFLASKPVNPERAKRLWFIKESKQLIVEKEDGKVVGMRFD